MRCHPGSSLSYPHSTPSSGIESEASPSLPPAALNLCSLLLAQLSQATRSQWMCSSPSFTFPAVHVLPVYSLLCSVGWFIPPVVGVQASTAGWSEELAGLLQSWSSSSGMAGGRAFPYWCGNTKKIAFKLGNKGSLLQAEHSINPSG